jgi:hypothetical protein
MSAKARDHGNGPALVESEATDQGRVVSVAAIPPKLDPLGEEGKHEIQGIGAVRMPGNEGLLPRREPRKHIAPFRVQGLTETAGLRLFLRVSREGSQIVDLLLQGEQRRFEVRVGHSFVLLCLGPRHHRRAR